MVRSPFAHAKITAIDTERRQGATNVVAVLTGADVADEQGALHQRLADHHRPGHPDAPADRGRPGRPSPARSSPWSWPARAAEARDAAELVDVDYEELPAALDLKEAPRPTDNGCLAHPDLGTNKSAFWKFDSAEAGTGGNVDEAIEKARADGIVIEREYRQQRLIPAFMEPRSVVVDPTGEQITMWSATQIPHILRFALAATTGVPESKIRVIAPDVGGGFGGKLQTTPEELIAFALARRLGKPVKYTETRSESLMAGHHGRDQWQKLTLAAEKDGTVTGLKVELLADLGSLRRARRRRRAGARRVHVQRDLQVPRLPVQRARRCSPTRPGPTPTAAPAGPEATYAIERIMDELAAEVGVDPLEIREKNWIKHEEFPFTTVAGLEYDSGNYEAATARGQGDVRVRRAAGRAEAAPRLRRHRSSSASASRRSPRCAASRRRGCSASLNYGAGGWEHASVRMLPTGKVEVVTGASAHGQGHETAFSQIVADRLGVAFEDVEVLHGDTQVAHKGLDTYGSRSLVVGGEALVRAADKVIEKAKPIAAHLLEASVDDIEFAGGRFSVKGTDQGLAIGRDRDGASSPRTTCPTGWSRRSTPTRRTTR